MPVVEIIVRPPYEYCTSAAGAASGAAAAQRARRKGPRSKASQRH